MRIDPDRQRQRAAAVAGLKRPAVDANRRAAEAVGKVMPALAAEVARALSAELTSIRLEELAAERREGEIMQACRSVARAYEALTTNRYTAKERISRLHLERAARDLKKVMDRYGRGETGDILDGREARP